MIIMLHNCNKIICFTTFVLAPSITAPMNSLCGKTDESGFTCACSDWWNQEISDWSDAIASHNPGNSWYLPVPHFGLGWEPSLLVLQSIPWCYFVDQGWIKSCTNGGTRISVEEWDWRAFKSTRKDQFILHIVKFLSSQCFFRQTQKAAIVPVACNGNCQVQMSMLLLTVTLDEKKCCSSGICNTKFRWHL